MFVYFSPDKILSKITYSLKFSFSITVVLLLLECLLSHPTRRTLSLLIKHPSEFKYDLWSLVINLTGLKKGIANFLCLGLIAFVTKEMGNSSRGPLIPLNDLPYWIRLVIVFICYDIGLYFLHRSRHYFNIFWIAHSFHHSSTFINPMTNTRQHTLDYINFYFLLTIPLSLLLPMDLNSLTIWILIEMLSQAIAHSNLSFFNNRFYASIFISPAVHHLHHSIEGAHQRKNFGSVFIFWDKLFGTYEAPAREYSISGVKGSLAECDSFWRGYFQIFTLTFKAMIPKKFTKSDSVNITE